MPAHAAVVPLPRRVLLTDRSGQTGAVRYRYTTPVWSETGRYRWNSNLNSNFAVQPVRTGIPAGLTGLPVGLTGNRPNSIFFWFKFKCPQSILNECLYNIFLNEPSNPFLYYFYINTMYNMFYIVFVYFCMHTFFCLTSNARKVY